MTDTNKLKELAERAVDDFGSFDPSEAEQEFMEQITPRDVLGLIAEVERLRARLEIDERTSYDGIACRDETIKGLDEKCDRLKAENEALRKDAERYRWLIASAWYVGPEPRGDTEAVSWHDHNDTMHGVTAAIDAALEGGGR
ncbi:hypothetical protein IB260_00570 [Pseudomonas sp. PDM23]|uniref:hypothetical protein n=1 Tax=unclassified Pseudomonas TaxID=196821 RepID=UPI001780B70B|nr:MULTISPECIES: hypothetical protein [unclassified Pseudomonas]MBD9573787.1 hypothetical protein [Pseudomonas sp. PDM23]MBD9671625.1 hypothetical protein [Pseudomonas sp. PDM21]